ncbi:MAG: lysophospholipid acyltransferase family protein [Flavitalea sp.]
MNVIKRIFGTAWAAWMIIVFIVTMLIFLIPFLLFCYFQSDKTRNARFIAFSRVWMDIYLPLIGCPLKKIGRENFRKGQNYIVTSNHNSFLDVMSITPAIPGPNKTIAKIEMARIPIFGMMYRAGSVLVDRKSDQSRKESYNKMKETLELGLHMCIYPEGTRNKTSEPLKSFHSGAFRLAVDTGKPIIPALMFNTKRALPADKGFYAMPHRLSIHFLPEVKVNPGETTASLQQRVFEIMYNYYVANK